jgi:hypothetical protein
MSSLWIFFLQYSKEEGIAFVYISKFVYKNNLFCTGRVPHPTSLFPPDLILYVNLVAKGAPKFFKTLAPRLSVMDIPYFTDAYSFTVRPIDLHNF